MSQKAAVLHKPKPKPMVIIVALVIMFLSQWSSESPGQTRQTKLTFKLDFSVDILV